MVEIKYVPDLTVNNHESFLVDSVRDFLKTSGLTKHEMSKLRFFDIDILNGEIDTEDLTFLDINEGIVTVVNGETIPAGPALPYVYVFIASFILVSVLTPTISIPDTGANRSQGSSTNSLGETNNQPATPSARIDDLFGTVTKHVPKLWQVPYRIGENNQEVEIQLLCVGRGKYSIDNKTVLDHTTPFLNIPSAAVNFFEPGTWPGNGSPYQQIGDTITRPIGEYRLSSSLNTSELLPPNDLTLGESANWTVNADGTNGTFTLNNSGSLGISLLDYFSVGQTLLMLDCVVQDTSSSVSLYYIVDEPDPTPDTYVTKTFYSIQNVSGDYEITNVTSNTVTVTGFGFNVSSSPLFTQTYLVSLTSDTNLIINTGDNEINPYTWFRSDNDLEVRVFSVDINQPDIGQVFNNILGPFFVEQNTTQMILNFTSSSGFYKVIGSSYFQIYSTIKIVVEETDEDGIVTGNSFSTDFAYSSHPTKITDSVYQTAFISIPYEYCRVYASRLTDRDKAEGVSNVDKIEWSYLYTYKPNPVDMDLGDVTLMYCLVPSNSQSRLIKERKTNLTVTRKITEYLGDGNFGPTESFATERFDQILIHTALDQHCGRLSLNEINADGYLSTYDQMVEYFGDDTLCKFGYDFDTTQVSYDDMFMIIANVVNCKSYTQNGKYDIFFEGEQTTSTMQITSRNKLPDTETVQDDFQNKYDGVELTYRSNVDGSTQTIYVPSDQSSISPEVIELVGCTTEIQAQCRADRIYNKQLYQRTTVTFDVDEFGKMIVPGQRIDSPDGTRFTKREGVEDGYRVYEGEVIEVNGLTVELSEPVEFTEGEDHYIQFTSMKGNNSGLIKCSPTSDQFIVTLDSLPSETLYDGYDRDRTKYTFCSEQLRGLIALIPETIESKISESGVETSTITSGNYDSRIYKDDPRGS